MCTSQVYLVGIHSSCKHCSLKGEMSGLSCEWDLGPTQGQGLEADQPMADDPVTQLRDEALTNAQAFHML